MKKPAKIIFLLFGLTLLSVVLHNAISALFKIEEPVFFLLTFVFALGFVIAFIYNVIAYIKKNCF
ncbi:MAG TPA: hypothetical protein VMW25_00410 [Clostridia bacterium]|nr:hypothetical protein [Clostridia bacterium]